jgi:hypothetical protein
VSDSKLVEYFKKSPTLTTDVGDFTFDKLIGQVSLSARTASNSDSVVAVSDGTRDPQSVSLRVKAPQRRMSLL